MALRSSEQIGPTALFVYNRLTQARRRACSRYEPSLRSGRARKDSPFLLGRACMQSSQMTDFACFDGSRLLGKWDIDRVLSDAFADGREEDRYELCKAIGEGQFLFPNSRKYLGLVL